MKDFYRINYMEECRDVRRKSNSVVTHHSSDSITQQLHRCCNASKNQGFVKDNKLKVKGEP